MSVRYTGRYIKSRLNVQAGILKVGILKVGKYTGRYINSRLIIQVGI